MNVKLGVKKDLKQEIFNSVNENVKALESLFPSAVKDGQVDFKALKEELGQFEEVEKEKYELTWSGKQNAKKQAQQDILGKTLKYIPEDSKNPETTENLYIEGDNLEVLKLLRQNYYGSIKMIYIDPPYNTGNDFIYNDKFSMIKEESDMQDGTISELGERYTVNKDTSNKYHANWLNMMYPRLKVAKDLLTDDGVIFISIDDNEVDNLRKVADEVFGEKNFISNIGLEITKTQGMKVKSAKEGSVVKNYEYILVYAKSNLNKNIVKNVLYDENKGYDTHFSYYIDKNCENLNLKKLTDKLESEKDILEEFTKLSLSKNNKISINSIEKAISISEKVREYIFNQISNNIYQEMACNIKIDLETEKKLNENKIVQYGEYLLTRSSGGKLRQLSSLKETLNYNDEYKSKYTRVTIRGNLWKGFFSDMMNVTKEGEIEFKNGKKPVRLIKQLAKWVGVKERDIILDFFSGSSTTAHAVMQLNAEDGGNRKFIMVQLPEKCDEKSEAYKAGYKNICEIGKERIRRAGEKIKEENKDKEGIEDLDVGFKVFRVGNTNIRWTSETVNSSTLDMFKNIENSFGEEVAAKAITPLEEEYYRNKDGVDFMPKAKDIDIVYEILLRQRDIHLSEKVELLSDIGERTYLFADSYLVCLEKTITKELIEKIASLDPLPIKFVFRDSAFEDNISLKDEAIRRLKALIDKNSEGNKVVYTVEFI